MRRIALTLPCVASLSLVAALSASVSAAVTPTQHYRWKDASGVVHFSDTIPASALALGYDVVDDEGRVVRHVARELTPAERQAAAVTAAKQATARRAAQQQALADAQMLSAYPTARDLEQSQQAQLQQIKTDIDTLQTNLHSQEDTLTELLAHAADIEHSGKPVPPGVSKNISRQRETVNQERQALVQRRADLAHAESLFKTQLQRYRALRSQYQGDDSPTQ
jgi:fructose-specific component phosphotransferase system IIB-like protein